MDHGLRFFGISKIFCRAVFLWRHQIQIDDVRVGKNIFFSKGGHVIYCWKASITLIRNHIRTRGWKWSPREIFRFAIGHVTNSKPEYLAWSSFSDHGSYVILNQRNTSFPTVYKMTHFDEQFFFSLTWPLMWWWRHVREKNNFVHQNGSYYIPLES